MERKQGVLPSFYLRDKICSLSMYAFPASGVIDMTTHDITLCARLYVFKCNTSFLYIVKWRRSQLFLLDE